MLDNNAQVLPASSERYNPDFFFSVSTIANTRLGLTLETLNPILPIKSGKPSVNFIQVTPSSVDFHIAEPFPPLDTVQGNLRCSHEAAYKTRGLVISIVREAIPVLSLIYNTRFQLTPPSIDL